MEEKNDDKRTNGDKAADSAKKLREILGEAGAAAALGSSIGGMGSMVAATVAASTVEKALRSLEETVRAGFVLLAVRDGYKLDSVGAALELLDGIEVGTDTRARREVSLVAAALERELVTIELGPDTAEGFHAYRNKLAARVKRLKREARGEADADDGAELGGEAGGA